VAYRNLLLVFARELQLPRRRSSRGLKEGNKWYCSRMEDIAEEMEQEGVGCRKGDISTGQGYTQDNAPGVDESGVGIPWVEDRRQRSVWKGGEEKGLLVECISWVERHLRLFIDHARTLDRGTTNTTNRMNISLATINDLTQFYGIVHLPLNAESILRLADSQPPSVPCIYAVLFEALVYALSIPVGRREGRKTRRY